MRIIAGTHRGRQLEAPVDQRIRPTADRVRESLFNILAHRLGGFSGKRALDGFAGTGALGLEALSRGAATAMFADRDRDALALCRRNADALGLTPRASFRLIDITRAPPAEAAFDLILLDPPYGGTLASAALTALDQGGWLAAGAVAAIETDAAAPEAAPPGFSLIDARRYGRAAISILTRS